MKNKVYDTQFFMEYFYTSDIDTNVVPEGSL